MAPNVEVHFWAANDINGSTILEITDEDTFFKGLRLTPDLYGLGGWELTLARAWGFQLFDSGAVDAEVFVRFLVRAYSDSTYLYGGQLNKRDLIVVDRDEIGAEQLVIGGPGPKQYLDRYRLEIDQLTGAGWLLDLPNGQWQWGETAKAGGVLKRLYDEDQAHTNPAMPDLTIAFDQSDDSDGNPWTDDIATDGSFVLPIGNSYLQTIWDLEDLADLYTTVHLGSVATPQYELNAFEAFGDDNTGSAFGSGVGLLREGVNIANDSLSVQGVSLRKATHVIVEGKDGVWEKKVKPSYSPGGYVKWEKISYPRSNSPAILEKAGLRWLQRQDNGDQELTIELLPGNSPTTGLYFPAPNDPIWLGNTISVDTVADGSVHSPLDYNNAPFLVTGIEYVLGPAGDDSTADARAKSWDIKVKLNHERGGNAGSPNQGSATESCPCHPGPEHPTPGTPGTVTTATGAGFVNNDDHSNVSVPGGTGGLIAVLLTNSVTATAPSYLPSSIGTPEPMTIIGQVTHATPPSGGNKDGDMLIVAYLANPTASGSGPSIEWGTQAGSQFGSLKGYWTTPSTDTPTVITNSGTSSTASVTPTGAGAEDLVLMCAGWRIWSLGNASQTPIDGSSQADTWALPYNNSAGQNDGCWYGGVLAGSGTRSVNVVTATNWVAAAVILGGTAAVTGDTTEDVGPTGSGDPGDDPTYSPIDHVHAHGLLAAGALHYHDASQVEGLADPSNVEDLPTAETDDTLTLAPDGAGGVEWVTVTVGEASVRDAGRWEPVTDGDVAATELIFEDGDVVMEWVTGP